MPLLLLFCLVSSQFAMTTVMARQFPFFFDGGASTKPVIIAEGPSSVDSQLHVRSLLESAFAGSPLSSHHGVHSPFDRKFAGGKIILAGLAVAIIAAVFCYIRITRTKKITEPKS